MNAVGRSKQPNHRATAEMNENQYRKRQSQICVEKNCEQDKHRQRVRDEMFEAAMSEWGKDDVFQSLNVMRPVAVITEIVNSEILYELNNPENRNQRKHHRHPPP